MKVAVLMGSDSDLEQVKPGLVALKELSIPFVVRVLSAHRTPEALHQFVEANDAETAVYICAAGGAAHLAGVVASLTAKPVIGIPILTPTLGGADSLYSMVQMPPGVPVATVGIGASGARNAGLLAAQMLALSDAELASRYAALRRKMQAQVMEKDASLQKKLSAEGLL